MVWLYKRQVCRTMWRQRSMCFNLIVVGSCLIRGASIRHTHPNARSCTFTHTLAPHSSEIEILTLTTTSTSSLSRTIKHGEKLDDLNIKFKVNYNKQLNQSTVRVIFGLLNNPRTKYVYRMKFTWQKAVTKRIETSSFTVAHEQSYIKETVQQYHLFTSATELVQRSILYSVMLHPGYNFSNLRACFVFVP